MLVLIVPVSCSWTVSETVRELVLTPVLQHRRRLCCRCHHRRRSVRHRPWTERSSESSDPQPAFVTGSGSWNGCGAERAWEVLLDAKSGRNRSPRCMCLTPAELVARRWYCRALDLGGYVCSIGRRGSSRAGPPEHRVTGIQPVEERTSDAHPAWRDRGTAVPMPPMPCANAAPHLRPARRRSLASRWPDPHQPAHGRSAP
jgi:hypothetical protein